MIKVVFFDFGGVLIETVHSTFAEEVRKRYDVDPRGASCWWREKDDDYYAGRLDGRTFFEGYAEALGLVVAPDVLETLYLTCLRKKPGAWEMAHGLAERVTLSVISDMAPAPTEYIREHFDLGLFDGPLFSSDVGMTKRDERLFRFALGTQGIVAAEGLLIDDTPRNLSVAAEMGMDTVLFESEQQLCGELARRGLVAESRCRHQAPAALRAATQPGEGGCRG